MSFGVIAAILAVGCDERTDPATTAEGIATARAQLATNELDDNRTVAITLPHDEPTFTPGPGRDAFLTNCIVCHSTRYIAMQPAFSEEVWKTEVHKMVSTYGAHITSEEEAQIVAYILTVRGAKR